MSQAVANACPDCQEQNKAVELETEFLGGGKYTVSCPECEYTFDPFEEDGDYWHDHYGDEA